MTIEKSAEEKFFKEAASALHSNDSDAIDALMDPVDPAEDIPNQEDAGTDTGTDESTISTPEGNESREEIEQTDDQKEIARLMHELEEAKKVGHSLKSDAGRVPQLQRKLSAVEAKLNEMAANAAKYKEDGSVDEEASIRDAFDNEHFALIEDTDPVLAKALKATLGKVLLKTQTQGVDAAREVTNAFRETDEEVARNTEWNALVSVVPDAEDIFGTFAWAAYKDTLTSDKLALAQSSKASDVIVAIQEFKAFSNESAIPSRKATQTAEERQRKLSTSAPGNSSAGSKPKDSNDMEALFKEAYLTTLGSHTRS